MFTNMTGKLNKIIKKQDTGHFNNFEQKLLIVTKARWVVLCLLLVYLVASFFAYKSEQTMRETLFLISRPLLLFVTAVLYNAFYHICWHRYPWMWINRIKQFIRTQLILDALMITILVHFTGGIESLFWTLYVLLVFEYLHLIPNYNEVVILGLTSFCFYTALVFSELYGFIKPFKIPFVVARIENDFVHVFIVWLWVCLFNTASVFVSFYFHSIRAGIENLLNLFAHFLFNNCAKLFHSMETTFGI